jgi:hypothetical protein
MQSRADLWQQQGIDWRNTLAVFDKRRRHSGEGVHVFMTAREEFHANGEAALFRHLLALEDLLIGHNAALFNPAEFIQRPLGQARRRARRVEANNGFLQGERLTSEVANVISKRVCRCLVGVPNRPQFAGESVTLALTEHLVVCFDRREFNTQQAVDRVHLRG